MSDTNLAACDCIPREIMPQIETTDYPELMVFLAERGIIVKCGWMDPHLVRGRQDINRNKVRKILATPDALTKQVLISREPLTIDGNHRWMAHVVAKTNMPFIQISVDFLPALDIVRAFPKTHTI